MQITNSRSSKKRDTPRAACNVPQNATDDISQVWYVVDIWQGRCDQLIHSTLHCKLSHRVSDSRPMCRYVHFCSRSDSTRPHRWSGALFDDNGSLRRGLMVPRIQGMSARNSWDPCHILRLQCTNVLSEPVKQRQQVKRLPLYVQQPCAFSRCLLSAGAWHYSFQRAHHYSF